jgi:hypothetical protein
LNLWLSMELKSSSLKFWLSFKKQNPFIHHIIYSNVWVEWKWQLGVRSVKPLHIQCKVTKWMSKVTSRINLRMKSCEVILKNKIVMWSHLIISMWMDGCVVKLARWHVK